MTKLSQHQAIVLHMAKRPGEWHPSHSFIKVELCGRWVGSRGDRSARDLVQKNGPYEGVIEINGTTYHIERKEIDGYAHYRVAGSQAPLSPEEKREKYLVEHGYKPITNAA